MATFNYGSIKSTNKSPISPNTSAQPNQQNNTINISYSLNDNTIDPVIGPQNVDTITITRHSSHIRDNLFNFNTGKFEKNYPVASQSFIGKDSSQIHSRPVFSPGSFNRSQIALSQKPLLSTTYSAQVVPGTNYTIDFDTLSVTIPSITTTGTITRQDLISKNGFYYFDLDIAAAYSGEATICYTVPENVYFDNLEFCHINPDGKYEVITSSKNPATREICGKSSSFSPFVFTYNSHIEAQNLFDLIISPANNSFQTTLNMDGTIENIERLEPEPCPGAQKRAWAPSGFLECGCYSFVLEPADLLGVLEGLAILLGEERALYRKSRPIIAAIKHLRAQQAENRERIENLQRLMRNIKNGRKKKEPWHDFDAWEKEIKRLQKENHRCTLNIRYEAANLIKVAQELDLNMFRISAIVMGFTRFTTLMYSGDHVICPEGWTLNSQTCKCEDYSDYSN